MNHANIRKTQKLHILYAILKAQVLRSLQCDTYKQILHFHIYVVSHSWLYMFISDFIPSMVSVVAALFQQAQQHLSPPTSLPVIHPDASS